MSLVFVYLGNSIPNYVKRNLLSLHKTFPLANICLIVSNSKLVSQFNDTPIRVFHYQSKFHEFNIPANVSKFSKDYRGGFWIKTIERFFALQAFTSRFDETFIHVEADNLLFENFPIDKLLNLDSELAYPVIDLDTGIASIMVVKGRQALSNILSFIIDHSKIQPITDMEVLGLYFNLFPNRVCVLPTANSLMTFPEISTTLGNVLGKNFLTFEGFFDGATFGQYIYGLDARTSYGIRKIGFNHRKHPIDPSRVRLLYRDNKLYLQLDKLNSPLFNLHIHSKNRGAFSISQRQSYFDKFLVNGYIKNVSVFSFSDFFAHAFQNFLILSAWIFKHIKHLF